jgi:glycosyltransferase involved in cell wall biosynthesis
MTTPSDFPLISIITVCRNAAIAIEPTISSVLAQTYTPIEYIIIDGASTDGTAEIIRQYESRLAYWHSKPDRGIAQAFNLGLEQAGGTWIVYLNADDVFVDSTVVGQMVPYLRRHPDADVIYGRAEVVSSGAETHYFPFDRVLGREWSWRIFRLYNIIPHQAAFTNKHYFAKAGRYDENCSVSVDYEHYLRGGKNLRAVFVPLDISKMKLGGMSNRHLVRSFQEYKKAQLKNRALSPWEAWFNLIYRICTYYGKLLFHKIRGQF